eukprot:4664264-Amphidinium_carterae.1
MAIKLTQVTNKAGCWPAMPLDSTCVRNERVRELNHVQSERPNEGKNKQESVNPERATIRRPNNTTCATRAPGYVGLVVRLDLTLLAATETTNNGLLRCKESSPWHGLMHPAARHGHQVHSYVWSIGFVLSGAHVLSTSSWDSLQDSGLAHRWGLRN